MKSVRGLIELAGSRAKLQISKSKGRRGSNPRLDRPKILPVSLMMLA